VGSYGLSGSFQIWTGAIGFYRLAPALSRENPRSYTDVPVLWLLYGAIVVL
jgi:hypothetical protein